MPTLNFLKGIRHLHPRDSILAVSYVDGIIEKMETSKAYPKEMKITVGTESWMVSSDVPTTKDLRVGQMIRGFFVEYAMPDDGATIFYITDFHPVVEEKIPA